jgi:predicted nucleic acid-binding protein
MRVEPFVDTNIWVYAHLDDASDPRCERAWELVNGLIRPVISPQVIAEYYNVMLRNCRDDVWIQGNLEDMLEHCILQPLGRVVVSRAIAIRARYGFSYWDCQIAAAALEAGCDTLFTEDLQPGQLIDGALTVANPLGT